MFTSQNIALLYFNAFYSFVNRFIYNHKAPEAGTVDALKNMSISEIPEKYHAVRNRLSNIPQIPNESDAE